MSRTLIGEYENHQIYSVHDYGRTLVGGTLIKECGISSKIYSVHGWSKTVLGECENGAVYNGSGQNRSQVGEYDGSSVGAAALLLLF